MEDTIEDIVGQIKYTDSQKSVTTSNAYSQDFTDSSSDKNQSSGKDTYIINRTDIDDEKIYPVHSDESILNLSSNDIAKNVGELKTERSRWTRYESVSVENTFTQTSKTVFELRNEVSIQNTVELQHFETQTSFDILSKRSSKKKTGVTKEDPNDTDDEKRIPDVSESKPSKVKTLLSNSLHDSSSFVNEPEVDCESYGNDNFNYEHNMLTLKRYESRDDSSEYYEDTADRSTEVSWSVHSDFEEDSLMRNEYDTIKQDYSSDVDFDTVENDNTELSQSLANIPKASTNASSDSPPCDVSVLTTVTEETNVNNSILDVFQSSNNGQSFKGSYRAARSKFRIQALFSGDTNERDANNFKLPPIYTNSAYIGSPNVNFMRCFPDQQTQPHPCLLTEKQATSERSEYGYKNPASGESPVIYNMGQDPNNNAVKVQALPPISFDMFSNQYNKIETLFSKNEKQKQEGRFQEINISDKIKNLKVSNTKALSGVRKGIDSSRDLPSVEVKACEAAEKGCDGLCSDIMRRLQSSTWKEIAETLTSLPKSLESFWSIMSEIRIADLLRQIVSLVESPRTQVATAACEAAAHLLKHTNYTKKPDFNEAVGVLMAKTNSYNRVVRRAANLALDELVSGLPYTHCIAAICVAGVEHKSPLVRCAASRLLIVCCALAEGGRRLLRCRPPSAAAARRHVLQAMAVLLQDKNLETRKYAERLYLILRPLPNFEAYFLTDVDAELATEHMKKYDHILMVRKTR